MPICGEWHKSSRGIVRIPPSICRARRMSEIPDDEPWGRVFARGQRRLERALGAMDLKSEESVAAAPRARPVLELAAQLLGPGATTVVDVGASQVGGVAEMVAESRNPGGTVEAWWRLHPVASLVGFEPDAVECRRLNDSVRPGRSERYFATALGKSDGTGTLHLAVRPACSSLYPPDAAVVRRYPQVYGDIREVGTEEVALTTLDSWWIDAGRPRISFIKLDTQGSEWDILTAGSRVLPGCLGLEVEVEFNALYLGQPLFHDVDRLLREAGFSLWRLGSLCHYAEKPK